jgi:hypothetical protein
VIQCLSLYFYSQPRLLTFYILQFKVTKTVSTWKWEKQMFSSPIVKIYCLINTYPHCYYTSINVWKVNTMWHLKVELKSINQCSFSSFSTGNPCNLLILRIGYIIRYCYIFYLIINVFSINCTLYIWCDSMFIAILL